MVAMVRMENGILSRMESSAGVYSGKSGGESMKRPQKLAVMLVPTPPYEICGLEPVPKGKGEWKCVMKIITMNGLLAGGCLFAELMAPIQPDSSRGALFY
jgi:hypothetical protein